MMPTSQTRTVGRYARGTVGAQRGLDRFLVPLPVDPHERPRRHLHAHATGHVEERALPRHGVVGGAGRLDHHVLDNRHRIAEHLEPDGIEPDGAQRAGRRVDQIPSLPCACRRIDVLGLAAATDERLALAGPQVEDGHLRVVRLARRRNREQHAAATRQHRWERMVALALRRVRRRQDRRFTAVRRHAPQTGARVVGGEHDRVVVAPARAERRPGDRAERDGRSPGDRHLLELRGREEPDPPAVGGKEQRRVRRCRGAGRASS